MNALLAMILAAAGQSLTDPLTPDMQVRACLAYCADLHQRAGGKDPDVHYLQFISWHGVPVNLAKRWKTLGRFVANTVNSAGDLHYFQDVPDTKRTLQVIDIRSPRWNRVAVNAVARRETLFREPLLANRDTESLRREVGSTQDPKTFHADAIIWAPYLMRHVLENELSPAYFDLLYATERFPGGGAYTKDWPGGRWTDGKDYPANSFKYTVETGATDAATGKVNTAAAFIDFPRNRDDWKARWGAKTAEDFFAKSRITFKRGDIVAGFYSDPENGSEVTYNDRWYQITPIPGGGVEMESGDYFNNGGENDLVEQPELIATGRKVGKQAGGEFLANLPCGIPAGMLTDANNKRINTADGRVARSTRDLAHGVLVKNVIACYICHLPDGMVIESSNSLFDKAFGPDGVKRDYKDREEEEAVAAFYKDWKDQIEMWRMPAYRAIRRATTLPGEKEGWRPEKLVAEIIAFRNWYDRPLMTWQMAAEMGVTPAELRAYCSFAASPRLNMIAKGMACPRLVWEGGTQAQAALAIDLGRREVDPAKLKLKLEYYKQLHLGTYK